MENIIVTIILIICVIIGIQAITFFANAVYRSRGCTYGLINIYPVYADDEDIEIKLRKLFYSCSWESTENLISKIYIVNMNADEKTLNICDRICRETEFFEICTMDELKELIHT